MKKAVKNTKRATAARTLGGKPPRLTKEMILGDVLSKYPQVSEVLLKHGFHCIGCMISPYESLEAGAAVHGIKIEPLLRELNKIIKKKHLNSIF